MIFEEAHDGWHEGRLTPDEAARLCLLTTLSSCNDLPRKAVLLSLGLAATSKTFCANNFERTVGNDNCV